MSEPVKGKLLVAAPALTDPNFRRTVIVMCEHSERGAMGVVINRPSDLVLGDALHHLAEARDRTDPLWEGGPVQRDSLFILHDRASLGGDPVVDGIAFGAELDLLANLLTSIDDVPRFRLYSGYAGWGEGQLEHEMSQGAWIVAPAAADTVFEAKGEETWSDVLRGLGGKYALLADAPLDPDLN